MQSVTYMIMVNWFIAGCSCFISVISLFILCVGYRLDEKGSKYLMTIAGVNILFALSYFLELSWAGIEGSVPRLFVTIGIFGEYVIPFVMTLILILYILYEADLKEKTSKSRWLIFGLYAIYMLPLVENLIHPFIYYIDEYNLYRRGPFFVQEQLLGLTMIPLVLFILYYYREEISREVMISAIVYIMPPFLSVFVTLFLENFNAMELATTISVFIMSLFAESNLVNKYMDREKEVNSMKNTLVLSQLRPHFLYNALSSISQLCKKNPLLASEMTDRFAEFLAKNMTDIQRPEPVPFRKELEFIENYVAIEQMRFGDELKVLYRIEEVDFWIPPLVLQPLIENAIKHGLGGREDGGLITISTRKLRQGVMITIADDGVGFDQNVKMKKRKERVHLGLISVRERLRAINGAELLIKSKVGHGTTAMVIIPDSYNYDKKY